MFQAGERVEVLSAEDKWLPGTVEKYVPRGGYYLVHTDSGLDYIARPDEFQIRKAN